MSNQTKLPLVTTLKVLALCYIREPAGETPYAVLRGEGPDGETYVCLVCAKIWDLDKVRFLVGQTVNVRPDHNGLKLKSLDMQPEETIQAVIQSLEDGGKFSQEMVEENPPKPQSSEYQIGDPDERAFSFFSRMLATVAEKSNETGIPAGAWIFMPHGRA